MKLLQTLEPGPRIFYRGEVITIHLSADELPPGRAFLRTNLGMGKVRNEEIVLHTETGEKPAGRAWRDLPMHRIDSRNAFIVMLPLLEVGIFEAKAGFRAESDGSWSWPEGENFRIKVEPAESVGANLVYTAFVRQFHEENDSAKQNAALAATLDEAGYTVIPKSGTFRALMRQLDFITGTLGSRILQLLPIHPTPSSYGRMGRFGSPFAALDYFAVNPELAEFDPQATPLEQFTELVRAVHARHSRIFLDIPVNHTGWGSRLQLEHPEWFVRKADGTFESPGAWGVVWADLCKLDYKRTEVHRMMAEVFLFWCRHGVDGFRCDAGYMLPEEAWDYIVAKVRREFPDTLFLLEGLGGPIAVQKHLLADAGLDWAYSELFQSYSFEAVREQAEIITRCSRQYGLLVNFAETHDNSRLAAKSAVWSRMRLALCALLSENGAFGFSNGVEWLAVEQIDVHENRSLNWGKEPNLVSFIQKLQKLLAGHPAFYAGSEVEWLSQSGPVVVVKRTAGNGQNLLAMINLDTAHSAWGSWDSRAFAVTGDTVELFSDHKPICGISSWELEPGGCAVLMVPYSIYPVGTAEPPLVLEQRMRFMALHAWNHWREFAQAQWPDASALALHMRRDYDGFLQEAAKMTPAPVTVWHVGRDHKRIVPVPDGDLLSLRSEKPFRAAVWRGNGEVLATDWSVPDLTGKLHFWHTPLPRNCSNVPEMLRITVGICDDGRVRGEEGVLQLLSDARHDWVNLQLPGGPHLDDRTFFLGTTALGGMSQVRARWGEIGSKYDAWLAANVEEEFPTDRRVMLNRLRAWVVVDAYSQELDAGCTVDFAATAQNVSRWRFAVPIGAGRTVGLTVELQMAVETDAIRIVFTRNECCNLPATTPVRIIVRPDIDDRINHEVTKAYRGAEKHFPASISLREGGFDFTPTSGRSLTMLSNRGAFISEPEWNYMVPLALEHYYGLDDVTDMFSPGYFSFNLLPEESTEMRARVNFREALVYPPFRLRTKWTMHEAAFAALERFVVKRGKLASVIAGYPWFLDWGRDTLIALRGLIVAGFSSPAQAIIRQFAQYEDKGTIPNMIRGNDVSNRDTSDAPLWLFVATRDYIECTHDNGILDADCEGRKLREVLQSIIDHYCQGTPNGILMDPESQLIFSPPHFTWMDTNYPAASPRNGYPIEIQALWYAANHFMGEFAGNVKCAKRAIHIQQALKKFFFLPDLGRFSDCLHCESGIAASRAVPDNAVRPNQLFALTLGAVAESELQVAILDSAAELLVPGAIRSLADRPVQPSLPVVRDGQLLNDPEHPYQGFYRGPEDTARKVAYHNGTAWCWPFPSYAEALYRIGGEPVRKRALAILYSGVNLWHSGAMGQLPEVLDGDAPHRWGGCGTQAWSVTEFYRVNHLLTGK